MNPAPYRELTAAELDEFYERSKDDYTIHVGSDIRVLVRNVRRAREQAADLQTLGRTVRVVHKLP